MIEKVLESVTGTRPVGKEKTGLPGRAARRLENDAQMTGRGSGRWIPSASYCTTGQFMKLRGGYSRHCGPTATVNLIRTLENGAREETGATGDSAAPVNTADAAGVQKGRKRFLSADVQSAEQLFLLCADIGKNMHIYWNTDVLGRFGGTSNFLTTFYLRRCLRAAGLGGKAVIRFHPWITPDAVEKALEQGSIVYLEVYRHPKYRSHHMLCYGCRHEKGGKSETGQESSAPVRRFLLADGWISRPVWVTGEELGHGHFLTISV
ncbi:MAG: hypothetical protein Q4F43_05350 [Eubacteriales bacterium]|nr:hypothetical protein [Eubacteriales bacterium]